MTNLKVYVALVVNGKCLRSYDELSENDELSRPDCTSIFSFRKPLPVSIQFINSQYIPDSVENYMWGEVLK